MWQESWRVPILEGTIPVLREFQQSLLIAMSPEMTSHYDLPLKGSPPFNITTVETKLPSFVPLVEQQHSKYSTKDNTCLVVYLVLHGPFACDHKIFYTFLV